MQGFFGHDCVAVIGSDRKTTGRENVHDNVFIINVKKTSFNKIRIGKCVYAPAVNGSSISRDIDLRGHVKLPAIQRHRDFYISVNPFDRRAFAYVSPQASGEVISFECRSEAACTRGWELRFQPPPHPFSRNYKKMSDFHTHTEEKSVVFVRMRKVYR